MTGQERLFWLWEYRVCVAGIAACCFGLLWTSRDLFVLPFIRRRQTLKRDVNRRLGIKE